MSAAKMVADSTQSDPPEMSVTKKRKKLAQKKKLKKKKETTKKGKKKGSEEDFDEHDLDLDLDIYPLGHYVKEREELLGQLFHCVQGASLQRTIPDVLKDLSMAELKKRCLEELEVMSRKRIRRILAGDDPASISSSGTEEDTSEEEEEEQIQDFQEGEEEIMYEDEDSQMVDSTSIYTQDLSETSRDVPEHEEGSLGYTSHSPSPSGEDQADNPEMEYRDSEENAEEGEVEGEPAEPEDPEEGEVFDDENQPVEGQGKATVAAGVESEAKVQGKDMVDSGEKTEDGCKDESAGEAENVGGDGSETVEVAKESGGEIEHNNDDEEVEEGEEEDDTVVSDTAGQPRRVVRPPSEAIAPVLTRNQMELLELEMRARAIKAMLKTAK